MTSTLTRRSLLPAAGFLASVAFAAALRLHGQASTAAPAATPTAPPVAPNPAQIGITITGEAGRRIPIAIPPAIAPLSPDLQAQVVDPFFRALTDDVGGTALFLLADPSLFPKGMRPPGTREEGDAWIATGAQFLLDTQIQPEGEQVLVIAQLYDLRTLKPILGKRYQGERRSARRIAHYLANDLMRQFTGQPGPFLAKLVFVSDRDGGGSKEIYSMDYDGESQRRVTGNGSLSLAPDVSFDGQRIVYQLFPRTGAPGQPTLQTMARDGSGRAQIPLATQLNASPSFSPDAKTVAFCGSVKGNPEIFTVALDGSNLKRLTDSASIDSTPRFSPNGREIVFTSNRQGSPQLYAMDTEGANVRRLTFAGSWGDEATYSPKGDKIAYACRNEGDFQICVLDLLSNRTFQISSGAGANENPSWSPDGSLIAWQRQVGSTKQIVTARVDGTNLRVLTSQGNNTSPVWSKSLE